MVSAKETALNRIDPRYEELRRVMWMAYDQATTGKGDIRHADILKWQNQMSLRITRMVGIGFPLGQALKKIEESLRLKKDDQIQELLGAVNYLLKAICYLDNWGVEG